MTNIPKPLKEFKKVSVNIQDRFEVVKGMIYVLSFYDNCFEYRTIGEFKHKDEDTEIWKTRPCKELGVYKRKDLVNVELMWDEPDCCWTVSLEFNGAQKVGFRFPEDKPEDADEFFNYAKSWMLE